MVTMASCPASARKPACPGLRSSWEVEHWPSPLAELSIYEHTPLWTEDMDGYAQGLSLAEAYWAMTVRLRPELARVFERLAVLSRRGPVVAHCFSGRIAPVWSVRYCLMPPASSGARSSRLPRGGRTWTSCSTAGWPPLAHLRGPSWPSNYLLTEIMSSVLRRLDEQFGGTKQFLLRCSLAAHDLDELCPRFSRIRQLRAVRNKVVPVRSSPCLS